MAHQGGRGHARGGLGRARGAGIQVHPARGGRGRRGHGAGAVQPAAPAMDGRGPRGRRGGNPGEAAARRGGRGRAGGDDVPAPRHLQVFLLHFSTRTSRWARNTTLAAAQNSRRHLNCAPVAAAPPTSTHITEDRRLLVVMESTLLPFEKLRLGVIQTVRVPYKVMLGKVLENLGSPTAPIFRIEEQAGQAYKATVVIDVSTCNSAGSVNLELTPRIVGEICASEDSALQSASFKALQYLQIKAYIYILDHSSKVAKQLDDKDTSAHALLASDAVERGIEYWDESVQKLVRFKQDIERKKIRENNQGNLTAVGLFYEDVVNSIGNNINNATARIKDVFAAWSVYEQGRLKWKEEKDSRACDDDKVGKQAGHFTGVDLLGYLLFYFGLPEAIYECEVKCGGYEGVVKVTFPPMYEVGCGGTLVFRSYNMDNAKCAREHAADAAIDFFKNTLKVKIEDFNYQKEYETKQAHSKIEFLLTRFLENGENLRSDMSAYLDNINAAYELYGQVTNGIARHVTPPTQLFALDFCAEQLQSIRQNATINYERFADKMKSRSFIPVKGPHNATSTFYSY